MKEGEHIDCAALELRASFLQERTPHSSSCDYNCIVLCVTISRIVGGQCRKRNGVGFDQGGWRDAAARPVNALFA